LLNGDELAPERVTTETIRERTAHDRLETSIDLLLIGVAK
jgi:hypothetical protein